MTAPEMLKAMMPKIREIEQNLIGFGYVRGTKEWGEAFEVELAFYRKFVGV